VLFEYWRERLGIEPSKRLSAVSTVLKTAAGTSHAIIPNIKLSHFGLKSEHSQMMK